MESRYKELVKKSIEYFSKLDDKDLFSSKVNHIYYNGVVTTEKAQIFRNLFLSLNETKYINGVKELPKPIVIHLNSPGGDVLGIDIFETLIYQSRVPVAVIIEDLCASAATFLGLYAPYRIMIDYSNYLIHDSAGISFNKTSTIVQDKKFILDMFVRYKYLLKNRTKLSDKDIEEYINRDVMITTDDCLKKGIIDRILKFPKIKDYQIGKSKNGNMSLPLKTFLIKTNYNTINVDLQQYALNGSNGTVKILNDVYFSEIYDYESFIYSLDSMILSNDNIKQMKPLVLQIVPSYSFTDFISNPIFSVGILYRIALIQSLGLPVIAYIEGLQNLSTMFLSLMCPSRVALKPSMINTVFTYNGTKGGWKFIDQIYNTKLFYNELVRFSKSFSKLPNKFYYYLDKSIINISPKEQLKYNLIHNIIDSHPVSITNKNISNYLRLNQLSLNYIKNNVKPKKTLKLKQKLKPKSKSKSKSK